MKSQTHLVYSVVFARKLKLSSANPKIFSYFHDSPQQMNLGLSVMQQRRRNYSGCWSFSSAPRQNSSLFRASDFDFVSTLNSSQRSSWVNIFSLVCRKEIEILILNSTCLDFDPELFELQNRWLWGRLEIRGCWGAKDSWYLGKSSKDCPWCLFSHHKKGINILLCFLFFSLSTFLSLFFNRLSRDLGFLRSRRRSNVA